MDTWNASVEKLSPDSFPKLLHEIPDKPKVLYLLGSELEEDSIFLSVVGSRKYTPYGKQACEDIIAGLQGLPITIVSGLAIGIDSIAHKAALDAGLKTIAVPGSGLYKEVLYPRSNATLAARILQEGGTLLSEFEPDFRATEWSFPQRNRIMAGMSHAVLVIEAEERSGTLITARLALDYNRDVFVVPGSIFSKNSAGTNKLIKDGAAPILSAEDLVRELGLEYTPPQYAEENYSDEELHILHLITEPVSKDVLIQKTQLSTTQANIILTSLELRGVIKNEAGIIRHSH